jgi:hypothetical protein
MLFLCEYIHKWPSQKISAFRSKSFSSGAPSVRSRRLPTITRPPADYTAFPIPAEAGGFQTAVLIYATAWCPIRNPHEKLDILTEKNSLHSPFKMHHDWIRSIGTHRHHGCAHQKRHPHRCYRAFQHRTFNPLVGGSNPTRPTKEIKGDIYAESPFFVSSQITPIKLFCVALLHVMLFFLFSQFIQYLIGNNQNLYSTLMILADNETQASETRWTESCWTNYTRRVAPW